MSMRERRFEIIEHTADKGVAAWGATLGEAFEDAAYGMFSLMSDLHLYTPDGSFELEVEGDDIETLFHNWLKELLFVFEVEHVLPLDFHITSFEDLKLRGKIEARRIGPDMEWLGSPVKAITYHEIKVEKTDGEWHVQAIVDV